MPRARTGFTRILYTRISDEAHELLEELWRKSGSSSRPYFLDALILSMKDARILPRGFADPYKPHPPVRRDTGGKRK